MEISLKQLECLVAVADHGSISAAADALGVAQPTVTHQLHQLEARLGYRLLDRGPRGATVRPEGQVVVERSRRILEAVQRLGEGLVDARHVRGQVRLGIVPTASSHRFPELYRGFRSRYPGIQVDLHEHASNDLVEGVRRGDLDLAVAALPIAFADVGMAPLWKEELVVVAPAGDQALPDPVRITDLAERAFVGMRAGSGLHSRVLELFHGAGLQPRLVFQASSLPTVIGFVAAGIGIGIAPADAVRHEAEAGTVRAIHLVPPAFRQLVLIFRSLNALAPAPAALARFLMDNAPKAWLR
jgi:DNA-binding transcriptional LysR family regulator